jgi:hypothetical protein
MLNVGATCVSSFQLAGLAQFSLAGWQCAAHYVVSSVAGEAVLFRKS